MAVLDKFRNQQPEKEDDKKAIEDTQKIWEYLRESRRRREFEWFTNDQYYDNNQYLKYNVASRRVQSAGAEKALDRVVINKVYQQVRGIVNFLNAEHPSVSIRPGDQADDAYLRAKKEQHLCDYWYDHLQMNRTGKKISLDACKHGTGWIKVLWNQDALAPTRPFKMPDGSTRDYMYGEVMAERVDSYDLYWDPLAAEKSDMRYMIHAPVRTVSELKNNSLYKNTDKLSADNRLAASKLRSFELRQTMNAGVSFGAGQPNDMDTSVVLEVFREYFDSHSNAWKIRVTTRTESGVLLRDEDWNMDEFPFEYFETDVAPLIGDSKGVIHNIREPNRALNEIISQVHETARIMGKLNWRIPRGSNVDVITDETGQFIEYDLVPGGAPEQTQAVNLPSYILQEANMLVGFMEDIGGMHASFNGNAPFAQASGDLVDSLSAGDQNNLTTMRDNYDDFWARTFKLMLKTAKVNGPNSTKNIPTASTDELGEYRWVEIQPKDISTSDDVTVSTGTAMPYSIAEKQQMYMNLWKEKVITDPSVLMKLLEMPDIDNLAGDDEQDIQRQLNEIKQIMKGVDPDDPNSGLQPVISENHDVHIQTLDKFVKSERYKELEPIIQKRILDHRAQHIDLSVQLTHIQQAMQVEPIKRSVSTLLRPTTLAELTPVERTQFFGRAIGIQSDAAEIQLRGGLYVEDPAQAEMQAQNEDIEMMYSRAVNVSFADNHQVHLETHAQVMSNPSFQTLAYAVQTLFKQHVNDHINAMKAIQATPGLVPSQTDDLPNKPTLNQGEQGQMPTPDEAPSKEQPTKSNPQEAPAQHAAASLKLRKSNNNNKVNKDSKLRKAKK